MGTDVVRLICPNLKCRAILCAPARVRGKTVRCRQCGMRVKVPLPAAAPAPAPAAEAGDEETTV
jgi:hypothetical protein